ncbi:MAG TPA: hypothetical protein PKA05_14955 [Roseiflexaceae bacterium]|nr:hypothetical protein [Roseiflexaceae bacterium]HMP41677.1 hypothetical protein [Roseiflexaceae bacterium]
MVTILLLLGVLIGVVSALVFAAIGALTMLGGVDATRGQIIPGFRTDRPGGAERLLTLVGFWLPLIIVVAFAIYTGVRIVEMILAALV